MEIKPSSCQRAVSGGPENLPEDELISRLKTAVCCFPDLKKSRRMEERHYKAIHSALRQRGDLFKKTDELKLIRAGMPDISIPIARLPVVLGTGEQADVCVQGKGISAIHFRLCYENGLIRLEDMGSKNGTNINGQKVSSINLYAGDEIVVGIVRLIVSR